MIVVFDGLLLYTFCVLGFVKLVLVLLFVPCLREECNLDFRVAVNVANLQ
jgi:hypothetical protein